MDYVEKARALRADPAVHYNCCQAVLVTFADRLGPVSYTHLTLPTN